MSATDTGTAVPDGSSVPDDSSVPDGAPGFGDEPGAASVERRSLGRLLLMCGVVGLILLVLGGVVAGTAMVTLDRHRADRADRLDPALVDVAQLNASLLDQETGIRGYVLGGGQPGFLDPYLRGRAQEEQLAGSLRRLITADEGLGDLLGKVRARHDQPVGLDRGPDGREEDLGDSER